MNVATRSVSLRDELISAYRAATPKAAAFLEQAAHSIPKGASRDALAREPYPPVIVSAHGAYLVDLDRRKYVDVCLNLGPILLGHGFGPIKKAIDDQLDAGLGYGAPTANEAPVAEHIARDYPAAEKVRFLSTGTEGILYALRVARAFTGRSRIVKFIGAFHGSYDTVQVSVRPLGVRYANQGWRGVPEMAGLAPLDGHETLAVPYNDPDALRNCMADYGSDVAAVILDPAMNACGLAAPLPGFLADVRDITHQAGALLVFDEVVTGFRYGLGGAAEAYGVRPDLVAFGKALGGGLPIGAFGGRADVMNVLSPTAPTERRVTQSGTFAANPLTMAASLALLEYVEANPDGYAETADRTERVRQAIRVAAAERRIPLVVTGAASMLQIHAGIERIDNYEDFALRDPEFRTLLFLYLALNGVFAPGPTGTFFLSWAHSDEDADRFVILVTEFLDLWKREMSA